MSDFGQLLASLRMGVREQRKADHVGQDQARSTRSAFGLMSHLSEAYRQQRIET
jgi:hypothetical protein